MLTLSLTTVCAEMSSCIPEIWLSRSGQPYLRREDASTLAPPRFWFKLELEVRLLNTIEVYHKALRCHSSTFEAKKVFKHYWEIFTILPMRATK